MPDEAKKDASEETKTDETAAEGTVTEEALIKSLEALEKPEEKKEEPKEPEVDVAKLEKTAKEVIDEEGSEELKKALDVSEVFAEVVGLFGTHIDDTMETLTKHVNEQALRDNAFVRVLERFQKSIDTLENTIAEFGGKPGAASAKSQTTAADAKDVLQKGAEGGGIEGEKIPASGEDPKLKEHVLAGLVELAKSAEPGSQINNQYTQAAVTFEATNEIDDITLRKALAAFKNAGLG